MFDNKYNLLIWFDWTILWKWFLVWEGRIYGFVGKNSLKYNTTVIHYVSPSNDIRFHIFETSLPDVFFKKDVLKNSQNSQKSTCARVSAYKVFSFEFCESFKNTFFTKHLWTIDSARKDFEPIFLLAEKNPWTWGQMKN